MGDQMHGQGMLVIEGEKRKVTFDRNMVKDID